MRSPLRPMIVVTAVAAAMMLGGCSVIEQPGSSDDAPATVQPAPSRPAGEPTGPQPSATPRGPSTSDTIDCGGADTEISGDDLERTVVGSCPVLHLSGGDLEVDLIGATVGELRIDGDHNEIDAASVATVTVNGQENDVEARELGSLDITGDRNEAAVDGAIDAVSVAGSDNEVEADSIAAVATSGSGNQIRTR